MDQVRELRHSIAVFELLDERNADLKLALRGARVVGEALDERTEEAAGILALAFEDNVYDPSDSFADSGARGIRLRQV